MFYLIKVEVNGIQDFIFNVKTKGAAKTLKSKSFFVDSICILLSEILIELFPRALKIYSGGGNAYLEVPSDSWDDSKFNQLSINTKSRFLKFGITISMIAKNFPLNKDYGKCIDSLNTAMRRFNLQPAKDLNTFFDPTDQIIKDQTIFQDFAGSYARSNCYSILQNPDPGKVIGRNFVAIDNKKLVLEEKGNRTLLPLPIWTTSLLSQYKNLISKNKEKEEEEGLSAKEGNIIGFNYLAAFAAERTGTNKIGVLKLDVDNLGSIFQVLQNKTSNKILSEGLTNFFGSSIINLLSKAFYSKEIDTDKDGNIISKQIEVLLNTQRVKITSASCKKSSRNIFADNIYPVYAGGDDCLFIGAWDTIIEFAISIYTSFSEFERNIRTKLPQLVQPITLSAAIILVDPHFPVVRFAKLAEEELFKAKANVSKTSQDAAGMDMKNNISFMGNVFKWSEFKEVISVKDNLQSMIVEYGEAAAFLQRIIQSFENTDNTNWHKCTPVKPFSPAIIWRFLYSFRDIRYKKYFQALFFEKFFSDKNGYHKKYILDNFQPDKQLSQVLPVAARWTEFLTRK